MRKVSFIRRHASSNQGESGSNCQARRSYYSLICREITSPTLSTREKDIDSGSSLVWPLELVYGKLARIAQLHGGPRLGSVERATQRKASSDGQSESSGASTSTRRRKTRRLADASTMAKLPITCCPPETSLDKLEELATCCGFTLTDVEVALKTQSKTADPGPSKLNE